MNRLFLAATAILLIAIASTGVTAQTVYTPQRLALSSSCRPSKAVHFWQCEQPAFHDGGSYNLYLPISENVSTTVGTPGFIIEDGKILVVTDVFITTTNGASWTPSLVRGDQQTGGFEVILQGQTAEKGWMAGGRSGRIVQPDESTGTGLALRPGFNSTLEPWQGTVSVSGYWIEK